MRSGASINKHAPAPQASPAIQISTILDCSHSARSATWHSHKLTGQCNTKHNKAQRKQSKKADPANLWEGWA